MIRAHPIGLGMSALQASWAVLRKDAYSDAWGREAPPWYREEPGVAQTAQPADPDQPLNINYEQGRPNWQDKLRSIPTPSQIARRTRDSVGAAAKNLTGNSWMPTVTPRQFRDYKEWQKSMKGSGWKRSDRDWHNYRYGDTAALQGWNTPQSGAARGE